MDNRVFMPFSVAACDDGNHLDPFDDHDGILRAGFWGPASRPDHAKSDKPQSEDPVESSSAALARGAKTPKRKKTTSKPKKNSSTGSYTKKTTTSRTRSRTRPSSQSRTRTKTSSPSPSPSPSKGKKTGTPISPKSNKNNSSPFLRKEESKSISSYRKKAQNDGWPGLKKRPQVLKERPEHDTPVSLVKRMFKLLGVYNRLNKPYSVIGPPKSAPITQLDLENAADRPTNTLCCATTIVMALQQAHPEFSQQDILAAATAALNTPNIDGGAPVVSSDGTVNSIYQFSQALSKNLGLEQYLDVSGFYGSVEEAQAAGAEVMKVELNGVVNGQNVEHHILQLGDQQVDPLPGDGISEYWPESEQNVAQVMDLRWYNIP